MLLGFRLSFALVCWTIHLCRRLSLVVKVSMKDCMKSGDKFFLYISSVFLAEEGNFKFPVDFERFWRVLFLFFCCSTTRHFYMLAYLLMTAIYFYHHFDINGPNDEQEILLTCSDATRPDSARTYKYQITIYASFDSFSTRLRISWL